MLHSYIFVQFSENDCTLSRNTSSFNLIILFCLKTDHVNNKCCLNYLHFTKFSQNMKIYLLFFGNKSFNRKNETSLLPYLNFPPINTIYWWLQSYGRPLSDSLLSTNVADPETSTLKKSLRVLLVGILPRELTRCKHSEKRLGMSFTEYFYSKPNIFLNIKRINGQSLCILHTCWLHEVQWVD